MISKYCIEFDKILDCYVVWENHRSLKIEAYRDESEINCENWIKENGEK